MALADTGGAAGMVATLVSLYGRADVPGRIALDNWPGPRAGHRIYRLAPVARLADARTVADPAVGYAAVFCHVLEQHRPVCSPGGREPAGGRACRLGNQPASLSRAQYGSGALHRSDAIALPGNHGAQLSGIAPIWPAGHAVGHHLPGIFSTFPVFIMERGFDTIPREVLESASIDGANQWQRFWRIGIPLGIPGLISALTLGFLDAWNAIEQPMTFLESPQYWPLSLFFTDPANLDTKQLGLAMAASLWMLLPSILVFRFGQTYLEAGLTKGAVKG